MRGGMRTWRNGKGERKSRKLKERERGGEGKGREKIHIKERK